MSYQSICEELPLLTRKQLDDIRKRCSLLMQHQASKGDSVEEADWLLEGILHECQHRGIYVGRTFHIKKSGSFAAFATKSIELRELLTECAPGLTPVQRVRLGQVCARELADYLGQPSFNEMMTKVHQVPTALNRAFPGYMQSRLLQLVVPYDGNE